MKYKIKFFPTKTMSVGLALVMIVSCFWSNADTIVLATTSSYETDTILCENDYSTANKAVTPDINGHTSGDMLPATDPLDTTNTVMHYKQSWYAKGVLFLGAEYESANASKIPSLVRDKAIQVKENVTYEIEYDYYVTGTPTNAMTISLAVGENTTTANDSAPNVTTSYSETIQTLPANEDATTDGWIRDQKVTITIPESADFTNGKYLMFYVTHGKTATICFDNIKVTALASVDLPESDYDKDTVLAYNDYSDALTQLDGTDVWPGLFVGSSGDAIPVNDPIDSSNQAMMYSQYWYGKGALFLGSDYMTYRSEIIKNEGIEVEPGITYEIKYDFYASGEVTHSMGLNVYLAVGNNAGDDSSEAYTITTSYQETIAQYTLGHSFEMSDWERDNKVWITIPEDVDLSNGSYLMIVAEHGAKDADIYFDNEAVRHYGVMRNEVTDIIITHADHDHIDGVHHFENAIIHIQEDEYARGKHYIPDTFKVELFKEDKIVAEEIKVVKIGGHQIGSCVVEFEFNDLKCVVVGDECYSDYNIKNKVPTASTCNIENSTAFIEKYVGSEYKLLLMHG